MAQKSKIQFRLRKVIITGADVEVAEGFDEHCVWIKFFYGKKYFGFLTNEDILAYANLLKVTGCKSSNQMIGKKVNLLEYRQTLGDGKWSAWERPAVGRPNKYIRIYETDERIYTHNEMCLLIKEKESW